MECNSFNVHCNSASPWYDGDSTRSMFSDDSSTYNNTHRKSNPLTKKEKRVIKRIAIVVLILTVIMSLLLGLERGLSVGMVFSELLLFGGLMPYMFIREILYSIKAKRKNRKHK